MTDNYTFSPDNIKSKAEPRQPLLAIYAKNGAGKTTFISTMGNPFVIDTEDKCYDLNVPRYVPKNMNDMIGILEYLLNLEVFSACALVVDTVDWVAQIIDRSICEEYKVDTVVDDKTKDLNYGKGHILIANRFLSTFLPYFLKIRAKHNVPIIFFAQAGENASKDVEKDGASKVVDLRMNSHFSKMLIDIVDAKMYIQRERHTDQKNKTIPTKNRYLITDEDVGIEAKNNLFLSDKIFIREHTGWLDLQADIKAGKQRKKAAEDMRLEKLAESKLQPTT